MKIGYDNIFDIGLKIANDPSLNELDYISYIRVLYFSYVFNIFGQTQNSLFLERQQFINAIREDRIPNSFNEEEINSLYNLITTNPLKAENQMNFDTFAFFYNLHRLFSKYALNNKNFLLIEETKNLLKDPLTPVYIILARDVSKTNFKQDEYLEASLYLHKMKLNENFFYSFKTQNKTEDTIPENDESRNTSLK